MVEFTEVQGIFELATSVAVLGRPGIFPWPLLFLLRLKAMGCYPLTNLRFGCAPLRPRTKQSDPVLLFFISRMVFPAS